MPPVRLPLEGLRILAVSQFGAGPYSTMVLADLGADVVKIEDPRSGGDVSRAVPPYRIPGDSLYFQAFNRNKRSLTLDLRTPEGRELFHRLVAVSHAVFNNLRGDETHKLGLDYEALREINREGLRRPGSEMLVVKLNPEVVRYLYDVGAQDLGTLEKRLNIKVVLRSKDGLEPGTLEFEPTTVAA